MEYLDLCRMRWYTSTKLLSVHVRSFLSVHVRESESAHGHCLVGFVYKCATHGIRWSSAGGYQTVLHYCGRPILDWGWIACIRRKASCTALNAIQEFVHIHIYIYIYIYMYMYIYVYIYIYIYIYMYFNIEINNTNTHIYIHIYIYIYIYVCVCVIYFNVKILPSILP